MVFPCGLGVVWIGRQLETHFQAASAKFDGRDGIRPRINGVTWALPQAKPAVGNARPCMLFIASDVLSGLGIG